MKRSVLRNFKQILTSKEHLFIWLFAIVISIVMLIVQAQFDSLNEGFWLSLVPNIIADMLSIIVATYIIGILLQKNEEKKSKARVYKMFGKRFENMTISIGKDFVNFVTKKPCSLKGDPNNVNDLLDQIQHFNNNPQLYIDENFLRKNIKVLHVDNSVHTGNIFDMFKELEVKFQDFTIYFKDKVSKSLSEFVTKYISVLPDELREKIFKVEDILLSDIFLTYQDLNIQLNTESAKFDPNQVGETFKELGEEIYGLITFFEENKGEDSVKKRRIVSSSLLTDENFILAIVYVMLAYIFIHQLT
ncbi:hypothetical protein [Priestia megaterium]|uniref:hypothetical protein n=1 Tax=Priestia megaterium TaxID=1404 RepID=UPI001A950AF9|nr:hypothetical protein [Priestia megaterium]QSX18466.1 hypothetical protein J0P05_14375 [Priestia megaterium]